MFALIGSSACKKHDKTFCRKKENQRKRNVSKCISNINLNI